MSTDPPVDFGEAFLSWLRDTTEAAWRQVDEWTLEDYQRRGYVGPRWRRGTRWTGGLDDHAISEVEQRYGVAFPPQYRVFLQTHLPPRRLEVAGWWILAGTHPGTRPPLRRRDSQWVVSIVGADAIVYGEDLRTSVGRARRLDPVRRE